MIHRITRPFAIVAVFVFFTTLIFAQSQPPLDLTSRVHYQRMVEEVYWQERIWPQQNPAAKPSLEAVLSPEQLQAKAEDAARLSNALEKLWHARITGQQLQAEIVRMAQNSKQPEVLCQLFAALDNNPRLIAELLARPLLAERLARSFYQNDVRLPAKTQPFDAWWDKARNGFAAMISEPSYSYVIPDIADGNAPNAESWSPTHALPEGDIGMTSVWTGAEMILWGGSDVGAVGGFSTGSRYNPATDTWRTTAALGAPDGRLQHSAIWTGTEMIVWGGCEARLSEHDCDSNSGGRFNPATDTWTATNTSGAPHSRLNHRAVWTGTEMIVWGGCAFINDVCRASQVGTGGGRYNPSTDSWILTNTNGAPSARTLHTAVWTGSSMVVWGGYDDSASVNTGAVYNPANDSWTATAAVPANFARFDHTAVWTGREMIIWGGTSGFQGGQVLRTGARYNPAQNRWRSVPTTGAPSARFFHAAVWTGSEMVVWGGGSFTASTNTGGRYNPASNSWTPTSTAGAPTARLGPAAVWTGSLMVVWGGQNRTGGRYDPLSDTWTPTNANEAPSARELHTAVWTGAEMVVWGGDDRFNGTVKTGSRYNLATDSWTPTSLSNAPGPRHLHTAVWTGSEMVIWGGAYGSNVPKAGGRYNPATNAWTKTSTAGAPPARAGHSMVWTGTEMIVFGGSTFSSPWTNTGGRYNPSTDTWSLTSTANAPTPRSSATAVWSGTEMIVWGGGTANFETNTGGRYNPATNSWRPTNTAGALSVRFGPAAAWTGSRMLLWGGSKVSFPTAAFEDGALYDPANDTWAPINVSGGPGQRSGFTSVWSGSELIVWGGNIDGTYQFTGARYNLSTDSWSSTATASVPSPRSGATGVWTGSQMIVWGGFDGVIRTYTFTGGVYTPGP